MRANNRYERYVVATRDTGVFQINIKRFNTKSFEKYDHALSVCQFCLGHLDWEGFKNIRGRQEDRKKVVEQFTLRQFYERYPRSVISSEPKHDAHTAPLNDYSPEFRRVAERLKALRLYRCEKCGLDLSKHRRFLQAHHRNGQKWDNSEDNIAILCIGHHALEYSHSHVMQSPDYILFKKLFP